MWTEDEIQLAALMWRAAHKALVETGEDAKLADGYASALEMVLGPSKERR